MTFQKLTKEMLESLLVPGYLFLGSLFYHLLGMVRRSHFLLLKQI